MAVQLPSVEEQVAREHAAYLQVERHILETDVKPRVTQAIVDEHRERPIGKHSDELERVLIYLRKHHLEMEGKYILVSTKPHEEWRVATLTGTPGVPPELLSDSFADRYEAEHGLFLKRLADSGLLPA
jgi:signal recognition particle GTPase